MDDLGRWFVAYYDGHQWKDYESYDTKAEANRVAKSLRNQGNRTKVFWRLTEPRSLYGSLDSRGQR